MNLKKYSSHIFALFLFFGHTKCGCNDDYIKQEKEGYYTQNHYKLSTLECFKETIIIPESDHLITNLRKKLKKRIPEWRAAGTEENPYDLWNNFYNEEIRKVIKNLDKEHHIPLEKYYEKVGNLFKDSTETNEKEVIKEATKLRANGRLIEAFKACIEEKYKKPEDIFATKATLAYQNFLYFILKKANGLPRKLKKSYSDLAQWKKDGHPTGEALWKKIRSTCDKPLNCSNVYNQKENREAIAQSLKLIDKLADNHALSYKDLAETIPHGIQKFKDIVDEKGLGEKEDIKSLKRYISLYQPFQK
ncbi:hypothetical protein [Cardinium endosymbiont of Nabis limbatus]|uniref:hypothetical protein n=1 Tax=Cardinium endosymbiont of Nabis limbatus TaxID=3066217 RepID=UPI003AF3FD5B